jgi:hypothetical protein
MKVMHSVLASFKESRVSLEAAWRVLSPKLLRTMSDVRTYNQGM